MSLLLLQSNRSNSLQYILDDFICSRFGEDSYVHVYRELDSTKKRAVIDLFNNKNSGRFVVLIEKSSCHPSIKLSSVDFVILFNSDWTPVSDIKALQRMSIESKCHNVKVFRLYSLNSVEEKVLILAKKGIVVESSISNFSLKTSHKLLLWGTSYLFAKLNDFKRRSSLNNLDTSVEQKLLLDVLHELSGLLSCQDGNSSCSLILKIPEGGYIANLSLYGEKDALCRDDNIPHSTVWTSLLEGLNPRWKLLPGSTVSIKRRGECGTKDLMIMSKKEVVNCRTKCLPLNPRVSKARSLASRRKSSKLAGHPKSGGNGADFLSCSQYKVNLGVEETCNKRMKEQELRQKKEICEFYSTKREKRAKLDEEHRLELDIISRVYGETAMKQEEVKKLDEIYKGKVEELNCQMDIKRKELEDAQRALRIKEKQLKDRLLALSVRKNSDGPIPLASSTPLLNSESESQTVSLNVTPFCPPLPISDSVSPSEKQCSKGVEQDFLFCNGENIAQLAKKAEASNTHGVSQSTPFGGKSCQELQKISNLETDGDGSTNMEPFVDLHGDDNMEVPVGGSSGGTESRDVGLDLELHQLSAEAIAAEAQPENEYQPCSSSHKCSEPLASSPYREVHSGENEIYPHIGRFNAETKSRSAVDLGTVSNVPRQESVENLADLPISRPSALSSVSEQLQAFTVTGNSLPAEQPMTCLITQEIRQTDSPLTIPSGQTTGTANTSEPGQLQALLRNLETYVAHNLRRSSNVTGSSILPLATSHFPGASSLRSDLSPSTGDDPLGNELVRIQKEKEEFYKFHKDQVMLLRSALAKEIEEVTKKYELLVREAEIALRKKNENLDSDCRKVFANKILAETILFKNARGDSEVQVWELSSQQHHTLDPRIFPRAEPSTPQMQIGHQPSEIVPTDPLGTTAYPLASYQTRAPHLTSYSPTSSLAKSHNPLQCYEVPIQQNLVCPQVSYSRLYPIDHPTGLMAQHEGSQEHPVSL